MELLQSIQQLSAMPIPNFLMKGLLHDYHQPNDKIHQLLERKILQQVKKGLYIAGPAVSQMQPDPFLIANHIYGPSYVSLESALSHHGLIPERVYERTSVTTKPSKKFNTPIGIFSYVHLPLPYYSFGIKSIEIAPLQHTLIASPEKALWDKIITTSGVDFRSKKSVVTYMENDLRVDLERLKELDVSEMETWLQVAPKSKSLLVLIETIRQL
jgi:hypothetical protein